MLLPLLLAFGLAAPRVARAELPPPVATFSDVDGNVTVLRAGNELDAEEDMELQPGDEIRTDAGAAATVSFLDNHLVTLGERTTLRLTTVRADPRAGTFFGRVELATGQLFANFAKLTGAGSGFSVATGSTVCAVKGTTFGVEAQGDASTVSVAEGSVATSGLDGAGHELSTVAVGPGQESTVAGRTQAPAPPRPIDARRGWVREKLEAVHQAAEHHRGLRQSGDLRRLRQLRRRARAGKLDVGADPEARAFLAAHPEERERLTRHAERHRLLQEKRKKARAQRKQERQEERKERRAERRRKD